MQQSMPSASPAPPGDGPTAPRARSPAERLECSAMTDAERFQDAQERVKKLSRAPDTDQLLALYALFKQTTVGDVQGSRPGMLDLKGRAKFDAWTKHKGMPKERAMVAYVELVERLEKS